MALDPRFMESDAKLAARALEARHGKHAVEQQAQIQRDNFALAVQMNKQNSRHQFETALAALPAIQARAHTGSSGQNYLHYTHAYNRLLDLAHAMVAVGETVQIPERIPAQGATPMITIGPRGKA